MKMLRFTLLALAMPLLSWGQQPEVKRGKIDYIPSFTSSLIDARSVAIWTPENNQPNPSYRVIYMHDGQNVFDANITWNHQSWEAADHIQHLMDIGAIEPCIIVAIWNNGGKRHAEYFPEKPFELLPKNFQDSLLQANRKDSDSPLFKTDPYADSYLKFIVTELKPYVEKNYPVAKNPKHSYLAGASMGGLISWYGVTQYPDVFGGAACFSTHWPGIWPQDDPQKKIFHSFFNYFIQNFPAQSSLYFDHGSETLDAYYLPYQCEIDLEVGMKFPKTHYLSCYYPGFDHSEKSWSHHFEKAITFLMNP